MSAVLEHVNTTVSTTAAGKTTDIARNHENIDRHVANVAKQVAHLIQPIMAAWPWPASFPGQDQMIEAADLLSHLSDESAEWDQDRPKPSAAEVMAEVQAWLEQAINAIDTRDALDGHDARRLLIREALTRTKAASHWCQDAHARVEGEALQERGVQTPVPKPAEPADARIAQHGKAFSGIALQASILLQLLDSACSCTDTSDLHDALDATRIIVASIGSLADGFNDESVRGNQYGWHLGENMSGGAHA